jgi:hypothetical protein
MNLVLPEGFSVIAIDEARLQPFEDAVLITFKAPRSTVLAWCEDSGLATFAHATLGPQDRKVLRGHGDEADIGLCSRDDAYGQGAAIRVAVSTQNLHAIALYRLPNGR